MRYQRMPKGANRQAIQRHKPHTSEEQEQVIPHNSQMSSLISLQGTFGNQGVQRLLAQGRLHSSPRNANALSIQRQQNNAIQRAWYDDAWDAVSDTATGAWDTVSDGASSAWDTVSDGAGAAWDTVSDGASSAWDTVSEGASNAWDTVSEGASDAWDTVSEGASNAWDSVTDTASDAWDTVSEGASDLWGGATSVAGKIWNDISGGVSSAWDALSDSAKEAWEGVVSAAQTVGGWASDAWEGLKSLGEAAWRELASAGRAVWEGINWFGSEAWAFIKEVGIVVWEKLCFYGDVLWSFISNIPTRLWRLVVDGWEAVTGILSWLGEGAAGFMSWLKDGLTRGYNWAVDFITDPSLEKLGQAVKGFVSWLGDGALGALGWVWDGIKAGVQWALTVALHILELFGLGEALSAIWGTIFHLRPLTSGEIAASSTIHNGQVPYDMVWVDEGSVITKVNGHRAVATMHILHSPHGGEMSGDLAVHELTHVAQYEKVGAIYMAQAIHAQIAGSNYDYGDLTGKHFSDLDREAQAELCQDFYIVGGDSADPNRIHTNSSGTSNPVSKMIPLIAEMRAGKF